jgi:hypothetical protein
VPRSVFLGRPWPAPGEALWTDEDRAWALALQAEDAGTCGGCGQPRAESTDPANEGRYSAEAVECHGCVAMQIGSEVHAGLKGRYLSVRLHRPG